MSISRRAGIASSVPLRARRGLSHNYHPFDLDNGQPLDEDEVGPRLAGHFDTLEQIAAEAGLSAHATKKLAKARRVLEPMKATISFFWKMIGVWFSLWDFPEPVRQWMRQEFIPGLYLARVAEKASDAAERHRLREIVPGNLGSSPVAGRPLGDAQPRGAGRPGNVRLKSAPTCSSGVVPVWRVATASFR